MTIKNSIWNLKYSNNLIRKNSYIPNHFKNLNNRNNLSILNKLKILLKLFNNQQIYLSMTLLIAFPQLKNNQLLKIFKNIILLIRILKIFNKMMKIKIIRWKSSIWNFQNSKIMMSLHNLQNQVYNRKCKKNQ